MSLDVYLYADVPALGALRERIFIREDGGNREITREEWNERFPDREPVVALAEERREDGTVEVYNGNITHNLTEMADAADLYMPCWRPEEIGITHAHQLIEPLRKGLQELLDDPERFEEFNPENGWGTYDGFVRFVTGYLSACERYPEATVRTWR